MKTLIIYISVHHGNTVKVADVIGNILDADLLQVQQANATMLEQYDLIGFGSGVYFGKHHKAVLQQIFQIEAIFA
ncbi:MAG: flavodoxin domain-containing protein [Dehalococcoidia bacterium]